jgi:glycine/serine hydroxymethyltransferase
MGVPEMERIAGLIDTVVGEPESAAVRARVHEEVRAIAAAFPLYPRAE